MRQPILLDEPEITATLSAITDVLDHLDHRISSMTTPSDAMRSRFQALLRARDRLSDAYINLDVR